MHFQVKKKLCTIQCSTTNAEERKVKKTRSAVYKKGTGVMIEASSGYIFFSLTSNSLQVNLVSFAAKTRRIKGEVS